MLVRCLHGCLTGSLDTHYTPKLSSAFSPPMPCLSLAQSLLIWGSPSAPRHPVSAAKRCLWYLPLSHCPAYPVSLRVHSFLSPLPFGLLPFPGDSLTITIWGFSLLQFILHMAASFLRRCSTLLKYFDTTVEPGKFLDLSVTQFFTCHLEIIIVPESC